MAANEEELGALHIQVTKVLSKALDGQRIEGETWEEDGVVKTSEPTIIPPSAAVIMAALKLLKDNNITAVASKGSALAELQEKMEKRADARAQRASKQDLKEATEQMTFTTGLPN